MTEDQAMREAAKNHATDDRLVIPFTRVKYDSFLEGWTAKAEWDRAEGRKVVPAWAFWFVVWQGLYSSMTLIIYLAWRAFA